MKEAHIKIIQDEIEETERLIEANKRQQERLTGNRTALNQRLNALREVLDTKDYPK